MNSLTSVVDTHFIDWVRGELEKIPESESKAGRKRKRYVEGLECSNLVRFYFEFCIGRLGRGKKMSCFPIKTGCENGIDAIEKLNDYRKHLIYTMGSADRLAISYFKDVIDLVVYEMYFEDELRIAGKGVIRYLDNLIPIKDEMDTDKKTKVVHDEFIRLYDRTSKVRLNVETASSMLVVRLIQNAVY